MKDLISKLTFGFLMAQFVPGAIFVYSLSFVYVTFTGDIPQEIKEAAIQSVDIWASPLRQVLIFLILAIGSGMAIHGLHWAVLGFIEHQNSRDAQGRVVLNKVYESFWHDKLLVVQIFLAPIKIFIEIIRMLFQAKRLTELAIDENVCALQENKMDAFRFLQDFYLHFLQFYAHTSYALVFLFLCLLVSTFFSTGLAFSLYSAISLIFIWLLSGYFFIISRVQMASLFTAENKLCARQLTRGVSNRIK